MRLTGGFCLHFLEGEKTSINLTCKFNKRSQQCHIKESQKRALNCNKLSSSNKKHSQVANLTNNIFLWVVKFILTWCCIALKAHYCFISCLQSVHQLVVCREHTFDPSVSGWKYDQRSGLPVSPWLCQSLRQPDSTSTLFWLSFIWLHSCAWGARGFTIWQFSPCTPSYSLDPNHTVLLVGSWPYGLN